MATGNPTQSHIFLPQRLAEIALSMRSVSIRSIAGIDIYNSQMAFFFYSSFSGTIFQAGSNADVLMRNQFGFTIETIGEWHMSTKPTPKPKLIALQNWYVPVVSRQMGIILDFP